jgi:OOP family OmpA-OmpF porin
MQPQRFVLALALAAIAAAASPAAMAAEQTGIWYLGIGAGQSRAKIEDSGINAVLSGTGATAAATVKNEHSFEYKAFVGYQFNRYFAVEGGYFNLGKFSFDSTTAPPGTLHGDLKNSYGLNVDALGMLPIVADRFSLFGRVGVQSSKTSDLFTGTGAGAVPVNPAPSKNLTNYKAGVGMEFDFTRNVGLRGEWERYRISDGFSGRMNVDVFSASLLYKF